MVSNDNFWLTDQCHTFWFNLIFIDFACFSGTPDHVPAETGEWHLSDHGHGGWRLRRQTQPQIHPNPLRRIRHFSEFLKHSLHLLEPELS